MKNWKNKKVLVVGLGKSGRAAVALLARQGAKVFATDFSQDKALKKEIQLLQKKVSFDVELGGHSEAFVDGADLVVVSPGVPPSSFPLVRAKEKRIPVIGELELASLFHSKPVIAVTGSNGKSTTSILIYEMLKAHGKKVLLGGNFGTPFSELLLEETPVDIYVLEVSSFQLERIEHFSPEVSVLTNLSPNHLDRYSSYEDYCWQKGKLFAAQEKKGWGILRHKEYLFLKELGVSFPENVILIDAKNESAASVFVGEGALWVSQNKKRERVCDLSEMILKGKHNLENSLAAMSAVLPFGVSAASIRKVLTQFQGLSHRIEKVLSLEGVDYINDSKSTSIDAVRTALNCFDSVLWIAGGRNKGSDFSSLIAEVGQKVRAAFFIGESQELLAQTFGSHVSVAVFPSLQKAVFRAKEEAKSGDVVLFSPGCSSFDMFHDFEHRGDCFKRIVKNLKIQAAKSESLATI